jgi:hypothetical protein
MNWTAHEDIPKGSWVKKVDGLRCQCFARCKAGDMIFAVAVDDFAKGDRAQLVEFKGTNRKELIKPKAVEEVPLANPIGIIVNARVHAVQDEMLSYAEVVQLAFANPPQHLQMTVQYSRALFSILHSQAQPNFEKANKKSPRKKATLRGFY